MEDGGGCGFAASNVSTIGLATALSDQGGHTAVLTIPADQPGQGLREPVRRPASTSARRRATSAARATPAPIEEGAVAPPVSGFQHPVRRRRTPTPTPTPTARHRPPPRSPARPSSARSSRARCSSRLPGASKFVELDPHQARSRSASTIDTKDGTIQLTAQQKKGGKPQTAKFFDGIFKLTQTKTTTDLTLTEKLAQLPEGARRRTPPPRSPRRASSGATARARSAPAASTAPRPCAARSGSSRTPAPARSRRVTKGVVERARQRASARRSSCAPGSTISRSHGASAVFALRMRGTALGLAIAAAPDRRRARRGRQHLRRVRPGRRRHRVVRAERQQRVHLHDRACGGHRRQRERRHTTRSRSGPARTR